MHSKFSNKSVRKKKVHSTSSLELGSTKNHNFPLSLPISRDDVFVEKRNASLKSKDSFFKKKFTPKKLVDKKSGEVA